MIIRTKDPHTGWYKETEISGDRFTGHTLKDGTKVFEGDRVHAYKGNSDLRDKTRVYIVTWVASINGFALVREQHPGWSWYDFEQNRCGNAYRLSSIIDVIKER